MTERELFADALEIADPAKRRSFLEQRCGSDYALLSQVESLLLSYERAQGFLSVPAMEQTEGSRTGRPDRNASDTEPTELTDGVNLSFLSRSTKPGSLGRLGNYDILEVVGCGGFGIVLKGFDEALQRVVAIKVMAPQIAASGKARKRFEREAQAAAAVTHENLVTIHAIDNNNGFPFLVMPFIVGQSLQQKLDDQGALELNEILRIGLQIARGLAAAHQQGLVHRDIKPSNILLENHIQKVKITDFGLARTRDDASITESGIVSGTPLFMAPEQARGESVDQRADIFSLGSVLYMMCTGQPAFRAGNTMGVLKKVCDETPTPIRDLRPDIPEWMSAIVDLLLSKSAADRFQTADELANLLEAYLAHLQEPRQHPQPTQLFEPVPETKEAAPRRRRGLVAVVALMAMLGFLILAEIVGVTAIGRTINDRWFAAPVAVVNDPIDGKEPPITVVPPPQPSERDTALAFVAIGGQIKVNGEDKIISLAIDIPAEVRRVHWVKLMDNPRVTNESVAMLKCCPNLEGLNLAGTAVTDEWLSALDAATGLEVLYLDRTAVSDASIDCIAKQKKLRALGLFKTKVTDAALEKLKSCRQLSYLHLWDTKISDSGVMHLKEMPQLTTLFISETRITDASVPVLCSLPSLRFLNICNTEISAEGLARLREAKPKCVIEHTVKAPQNAAALATLVPSEAGKAKFTVRPTERMVEILFAPDGKTLLCTGDEPIRIVDAETGEVKQSWKGHKQSRAVTWMPDGKRLLSGGGEGRILLFGPSGNIEREFTASGISIRSLDVSADNKLVAATWLGMLRIFDLETGKWTDVGQNPYGCRFVGLGGPVLTTQLNNGIRGFDLAEKKWFDFAPSIAGLTGSTDVHRPSKRIAFACADKEAIFLLDLDTAEPRGELSASGAMPTVCFSPNGRLLAHGCIGNRVTVFDVASKKAVAEITMPQPDPAGWGRTASVAFAPDSRTLAVASERGFLSVVQLAFDGVQPK